MFKYEPGATDARGRALAQAILPGAERSARQAAAARGAKITTRTQQKAAGGMFEERTPPAPDLFNRNPRRRKKRRAGSRRRKMKVTRLRHNRERGYLPSDDPGGRISMHLLRTGQDLSDYNRRTARHGFRFEDVDPLDEAFPVGFKRRLQAFTDAEGKIHPIRASSGYDPFRTTDRKTRKYRHLTAGAMQHLSSNPKKKRTAKKPAARSARRSAPRPAAPRRPAIRVTPDDAARAVGRAAEALRMDQLSQAQLVKLHNKISRRRRKSFTDVAVMNAAKVAAIAKGAGIKQGGPKTIRR